MNLEKVRNAGRGVASIYKVLIPPGLPTAVTISCNKNSTFRGTDMVPTNDRISSVFFDKSTIRTSLATVDSVASNLLHKAIIGSNLDPVFGKVSTSLIAQFSPSSATQKFGTNPVADSIILSLLYENIFGKRSSTIKLKVFELNSSYYHTSFTKQGFNPAIFVKSYYSVQDPNAGRIILLNGTGSRKIKLNIVYTRH